MSFRVLKGLVLGVVPFLWSLEVEGRSAGAMGCNVVEMGAGSGRLHLIVFALVAVGALLMHVLGKPGTDYWR